MGARAARRLVGFVGALSLALLPFSAYSTPASAAAATGTLFAITGINQNVLSRLDPATGIVTPIEDLAGSNQGQLVTMTGDPNTHRLFAVRTSVIFVPPGGISIINEVLTINSQTGAFTVSQPVNVSVGRHSIHRRGRCTCWAPMVSFESIPSRAQQPRWQIWGTSAVASCPWHWCRARTRSM
jgi:hypothetical protein